jgi:hypothetical protein
MKRKREENDKINETQKSKKPALNLDTSKFSLSEDFDFTEEHITINQVDEIIKEAQIETKKKKSMKSPDTTKNKEIMDFEVSKSPFDLTTKSKKSVEFYDTTDLTPLKGQHDIEEIYIWKCTSVEDISILKDFKKLRVLNILGTTVRDLSPLENSTELEELCVSRCPIEDLSILKKFTKLKKLNLNGVLATDFSVLETLKNLEYLSLARCNMENIEFLREFESLKELNLNNTKISDLSPLNLCKKMEKLSLLNCPVSDITVLKGFSKLITLDLNGTLVKNIVPILSINSLKILFSENTFDTNLIKLKQTAEKPNIYCKPLTLLTLQSMWSSKHWKVFTDKLYPRR